MGWTGWSVHCSSPGTAPICCYLRWMLSQTHSQNMRLILHCLMTATTCWGGLEVCKFPKSQIPRGIHTSRYKNPCPVSLHVHQSVQFPIPGLKLTRPRARFWDWATNPDLPGPCRTPKISIKLPLPGSDADPVAQTICNPLWSYRFKSTIRRFRDMGITRNVEFVSGHHPAGCYVRRSAHAQIYIYILIATQHDGIITIVDQV